MPTAQWGLEVVGLEARAERMLQSQAPIRKWTGRKRVRKESGLWKPEAARVPCQPPSLIHSRVPRDQAAGAAGSAVARMSSQGPQGGFQVREGFLEEVEF